MSVYVFPTPWTPNYSIRGVNGFQIRRPIRHEASDDNFLFGDGSLYTGMNLDGITRDDIIIILCSGYPHPSLQKEAVQVYLQTLTNSSDCNPNYEPPNRVCVILTCHPGMKQDKEKFLGDPVTARLFLKSLSTFGAKYIISIAPHYADIPWAGTMVSDGLLKIDTDVYELLYRELERCNENSVSVTPCKPGDNKTRTRLPPIYSTRLADGGVEIEIPNGILSGQNTLNLVDDMISTAATAEGTRLALPSQITKANMAVVHALTPDGLKRTCRVYNGVYVTNTCGHDWERLRTEHQNLHVVDISKHLRELMAEAVEKMRTIRL